MTRWDIPAIGIETRSLLSPVEGFVQGRIECVVMMRRGAELWRAPPRCAPSDLLLSPLRVLPSTIQTMSDSTQPAQSVSDAVLTQGARNLCPPSSSFSNKVH